MQSQKSPARRPVNLSLDHLLVQEAKALGVNISQACETGLAAELARKRNQNWALENHAALDAWNHWIEENGLPLAEYRQF